jgi:hypothetical protein
MTISLRAIRDLADPLIVPGLETALGMILGAPLLAPQTFDRNRVHVVMETTTFLTRL